MRKLFAVCIFTLVMPHASAIGGSADALFERDWQWRLQRHPEYATSIGEHRFDAHLTDTSLAACRAATAHHRAVLEEARALDAAQLSREQRLSQALFIHQQERQLDAAAFFPCPLYPVTAYAGLHITLPELVAQMRFTDEADYRKYIARLSTLPAHVDGLIEQLREGVKTGWTAPKTVMRPVPAMLRRLREHAVDGPLGQPFRQIPATIDEQVRSALLAAGTRALHTRALPALQALEDYIRADYLPAARDAIAAGALPGGADYYAHLVRTHTDGELAPAQLHALGLREVARLKAEAERAIMRTGFAGSFSQFATFANTDKRLVYSDERALLERYRRAVARATAALPKLFATGGEPELLVKPAGALDAQERGAAWYDAGSHDRPAAIVVNTSRLASRPMWDIDTLALHEGVPGHHLQVTRTRAQAGLPAFRRHGWNVAYGEGWALYAESLGAELGLSRDAFSQFGYLNAELFRAARLVADTGIHAMGWSRQQALDYLNANTANSLADNDLEVDRYIAWPGQALGYKAGAAKIHALREKAQAALGERFNVRQFHAAVLDGGPMPMPLLEQQIDAWIAASLPSSVPVNAPAGLPAAAPKNPAPISSN